MHPTYAADKMTKDETVECVVCGYQKRARDFGWGNDDWGTWNFSHHGHFVRCGDNKIAFYCGRNNLYKVSEQNPWSKRPCKVKPKVLRRSHLPEGHVAEGAGEGVVLNV